MVNCSMGPGDFDIFFKPYKLKTTNDCMVIFFMGHIFWLTP